MPSYSVDLASRIIRKPLDILNVLNVGQMSSYQINNRSIIEKGQTSSVFFSAEISSSASSSARPSKLIVAIWADNTYIPTEEGWLYLAGHKDLFTGEIVGYAMGNRITKNLVSQSLFNAVAAKRPDSGLIHHSDRGSQYCAPEYRRLMDQFKMRASMIRNGDCYDNAPMESFWGTLKNELVYHSRYKTREQAIREITEHIEVFYNRQRRQERLR